MLGLKLNHVSKRGHWNQVGLGLLPWYLTRISSSHCEDDGKFLETMFSCDLSKHFLLFWPFVRGIHQPPVNSPCKDQWPEALMFSLICTWINGWVNSQNASDLWHHHAHYDVTVMWYCEDLVCVSWDMRYVPSTLQLTCDGKINQCGLWLICWLCSQTRGPVIELWITT